MAWKRYQVHVHGYGRKLITRPMGLKAAIALADEQAHHAVVTLWMDSEKVHDNGKAPAIPEGWYPADAQMATRISA